MAEEQMETAPTATNPGTATTATDLTPNKDGGVLKEILRAGTADESPADGCKVYVHYTGRLLDGTKFDSSLDRGDKFTFNLGKGQVIKAWDIGVASMKRGEFCKLTCKPEYAYGENGSPPAIPANATLEFEVELFDWEWEDVSEDKDKSITKQTLTAGVKFDKPNEGAVVEVAIKGVHSNDIVFDERELKFTIGEVDDPSISEGLQAAIKSMKKDEISEFYMKPKHFFNGAGYEPFGVPSDTDIKYRIELKSFEKAKEVWEMDDDEKLEQSEIVKAKGTEYFKAGNLQKAIAQYKKITEYLEVDESSKEEEFAKKWKTLKLAAHLNLALCYNKTEEFDEAVKACNEAIDMDKSSEKAFFRCGEAEFGKTNYEQAKSCFMQAKNLNPENKLTQKKIAECNTKMRKQKEKEKKTFAGMFDKFAKQDEKQEIRRRQNMKEAKKAKTDENATQESGDAKVNGDAEIAQKKETNGVEENEVTEVKA